MHNFIYLKQVNRAEQVEMWPLSLKFSSGFKPGQKDLEHASMCVVCSTEGMKIAEEQK